MENKNSIFTIVFASLLLTSISFASMEAYADYPDPISGETVPGDPPGTPVQAQSGFRPFVNCATDIGVIVAYDVSKNQNPAAASIMLTDLEANGFTVREVNISSQGIPSCIVKLVVNAIADVSPSQCIASGYSNAEANLIANWVSSGGELLLISENVAICDPGFTTPIVTALGATHLGDGVNQVFVSGVDYNPANPATMWSGVNSWQVLGAREYSVPTSGVVTTYAASGNAAKIAKVFGQGCVVMVGNADHLVDITVGNSINLLDHRTLALNNFLFLNECSVPAAIGGEIIPLDTTLVLVAGTQTAAAWMIPVIVSGIGIAIVIARKF